MEGEHGVREGRNSPRARTENPAATIGRGMQMERNRHGSHLGSLSSPVMDVSPLLARHSCSNPATPPCFDGRRRSLLARR